MNWLSRTILAAAVVMLAADFSMAQRPGGGGGFGGGGGGFGGGGGGEGRGRGGWGDFDPGRFFDRLDRNGDGTLTADEVPDWARERFQVEVGQSISREDFSRRMEELRQQWQRGSAGGPRGMVVPGGARPGAVGGPAGQGFGGLPGASEFVVVPQRAQVLSQRIIERYDVDGDYMLSTDELPQDLSGERLDRNRDRMLDVDEIAARFDDRVLAVARPALPGGMPGWFVESDRDGDGQIGMYEWPRERLAEFEQYDTNGDGFIEPSEISATPIENRFENEIVSRADGIIRQYDRNGNGILDRDEWDQVEWRSDPNQSDTNGDGRLTREEMAARLAGFFNNRDRDRDDDRDRRGRDDND